MTSIAAGSVNLYSTYIGTTITIQNGILNMGYTIPFFSSTPDTTYIANGGATVMELRVIPGVTGVANTVSFEFTYGSTKYYIRAPNAPSSNIYLVPSIASASAFQILNGESYMSNATTIPTRVAIRLYDTSISYSIYFNALSGGLFSSDNKYVTSMSILPLTITVLYRPPAGSSSSSAARVIVPTGPGSSSSSAAPVIAPTGPGSSSSSAARVTAPTGPGSSSSSAAPVIAPTGPGSSSSSAAAPTIGSSSSSMSSTSSTAQTQLTSTYTVPEAYVVGFYTGTTSTSVLLTPAEVIANILPLFPIGTRIATVTDISGDNSWRSDVNFTGTILAPTNVADKYAVINRGTDTAPDYISAGSVTAVGTTPAVTITSLLNISSTTNLSTQVVTTSASKYVLYGPKPTRDTTQFSGATDLTKPYYTTTSAPVIAGRTTSIAVLQNTKSNPTTYTWSKNDKLAGILNVTSSSQSNEAYVVNIFGYPTNVTIATILTELTSSAKFELPWEGAASIDDLKRQSATRGFVVNGNSTAYKTTSPYLPSGKTSYGNSAIKSSSGVISGFNWGTNTITSTAPGSSIGGIVLYGKKPTSGNYQVTVSGVRYLLSINPYSYKATPTTSNPNAVTAVNSYYDITTTQFPNTYPLEIEYGLILNTATNSSTPVAQTVIDYIRDNSFLVGDSRFIPVNNKNVPLYFINTPTPPVGSSSSAPPTIMATLGKFVHPDGRTTATLPANVPISLHTDGPIALNGWVNVPQKLLEAFDGPSRTITSLTQVIEAGPDALNIGSSSSSARQIGSSSSSLWSPFGSSSSSSARQIGSSSSSALTQLGSSSSSAPAIQVFSGRIEPVSQPGKVLNSYGGPLPSLAENFIFTDQNMGINTTHTIGPAIDGDVNAVSIMSQQTNRYIILDPTGTYNVRFYNTSDTISKAVFIVKKYENSYKFISKFNQNYALTVLFTYSNYHLRSATLNDTSDQLFNLSSPLDPKLVSEVVTSRGSSSSSARQIGSSSSSGGLPGMGSSSSSFKGFASSSSSFAPFGSSSSSAAPVTVPAGPGSSSSSAARVTVPTGPGSSSSSAALIGGPFGSSSSYAAIAGGPFGSSSSSAATAALTGSPFGSSSSSSVSTVLTQLTSSYTVPEAYVVSFSTAYTPADVIATILPLFPSGTRIATLEDISGDNFMRSSITFEVLPPTQLNYATINKGTVIAPNYINAITDNFSQIVRLNDIGANTSLTSKPVTTTSFKYAFYGPKPTKNTSQFTTAAATDTYNTVRGTSITINVLPSCISHDNIRVWSKNDQFPSFVFPTTTNPVPETYLIRLWSADKTVLNAAPAVPYNTFLNSLYLHGLSSDTRYATNTDITSQSATIAYTGAANSIKFKNPDIPVLGPGVAINTSIFMNNGVMSTIRYASGSGITTLTSITYNAQSILLYGIKPVPKFYVININNRRVGLDIIYYDSTRASYNNVIENFPNSNPLEITYSILLQTPPISGSYDGSSIINFINDNTFTIGSMKYINIANKNIAVYTRPVPTPAPGSSSAQAPATAGILSKIVDGLLWDYTLDATGSVMRNGWDTRVPALLELFANPSLNTQQLLENAINGNMPVGSSSSSAKTIGSSSSSWWNIFGSSSSSAARVTAPTGPGSSSSSAARVTVPTGPGSSSSSAATAARVTVPTGPGSSSSSAARVTVPTGPGSSSSSAATAAPVIAPTGPGSSSSSAARVTAPTGPGSSSSSAATAAPVIAPATGPGSSSSSAARVTVPTGPGSSSSSAATAARVTVPTGPGSSSSSAARVTVPTGPGSSSSSAALTGGPFGSSSSSAALIGGPFGSSSSAIVYPPPTRALLFNTSRPDYYEVYVITGLYAFDSRTTPVTNYTNLPIDTVIRFMNAYFPQTTKIASTSDLSREVDLGVLTNNTVSSVVAYDELSGQYKTYANVAALQTNTSSSVATTAKEIVLYGPKLRATINYPGNTINSITVPFEGLSYKFWVSFNKEPVRDPTNSNNTTNVIENGIYSSLARLQSGMGSSSSSARQTVVPPFEEPVGSSSSSMASFFSSLLGTPPTPFGSSSSERKEFSSWNVPIIEPTPVAQRPVASSSSYFGGLPGFAPEPQPEFAPEPEPQPQPSTSIPTLSDQLYPVSFTNGSSIKPTDINEIITALENNGISNISVGTTEDLLVATKFGLNWCYPSYIIKSINEPTVLTIFAASQPGKCGANSQRQLIKVVPTTQYDPAYVFLFGPKPTPEYSSGAIKTASGRALQINNFYEPITGASGFRNMRERFVDATTCYDALACTNTTVQAAVSTQTLAAPLSVTVDTAAASQTGTGSGSYAVIPAQTLAAPIVLTTQSTVTPLAAAEIPVIPAAQMPQYTSYYKPTPRGSSSSAAKAASAPAPAPAATKPAAATVPTTQPTQTIINNIVKSSPDYQALRQELASAKRDSQAAQQVAKQAQVVQYVQAQAPAAAAPSFYDPNAGFFANLFGEFLHDASRLLKGFQAI